MHEMGLMQSLLASAARALRGGERAAKLTVAVTPLAGVDAHALSFAFSALAADDPRFAGAELEVKQNPIRMRCGPCGRDYEATLAAYACPACGRVGEWAGGDDVSLEALEVCHV